LKYFFYKLLFLNLLFFIFVGCGYKPTSIYAEKTFLDKTYVDVKIDINNAKNSVLIKDAIIELLISKFNTTITNNKKEANSFITGSLKEVSQTQLQTDTQGYAKVYRQTVIVKIEYYKQNEKPTSFELSNYYDFTVDSDSSVTQAKKDEAVKIAINKALTDIFSKIAINSFK
jgi:hypothetical protein